MSSSTIVPLTQPQHDISIAEICIFAIPLIIRLFYGKSDVGGGSILKNIRRDGVILFCIVRIVGGALYLAAKSPTDSVLIGALILQSLGSTFLIVELTRNLVAFLDIRSMDFPRCHNVLRRFTQLLRLPIIMAIVLIILAWNIDGEKYYKPLSKASSLIILAVYLIVVGIFAFQGASFRRSSHTGLVSFYLAALSLPFLGVRVLYNILGAFRVDGIEFVTVYGNWKIFVAMSLAMEVLVVACLVVSGLFFPSSALEDAEGVARLGSQEGKLVQQV